MPSAKIDSLDAIKQFRVHLIKFAEAVNSALGNSDSDVNRAQVWIDMEAKTYWQNEIRKRQIKLAQALEALRMKELYKSFDGTQQSVVDEKKAAQLAKQRLDIAEQKLAAVRKYSSIMQREAVMYKGTVQRFATTVQSGTPVAIAQLSRVLDAIDRYIAAQPELAASVGASSEQGGGRPGYLDFLTSMTRPEEEKATAEVQSTETPSPEPGTQNPEPAAQEQEHS